MFSRKTNRGPARWPSGTGRPGSLPHPNFIARQVFLAYEMAEIIDLLRQTTFP